MNLGVGQPGRILFVSQIQNCRQQVSLARIVVQQTRLAHPKAIGNLLEGPSLVPALCEDLEGRSDNLCATLCRFCVGPPAPWSSRCSHAFHVTSPD